MGNYRRFTGSSGNIFKFETIGDTIEGKFVSAKEGKFGWLMTLDLPDGKQQQVGVGTALEGMFDDLFGSTGNIPVGCGMRIRYSGKKDTGQGNPLKLFELDVDEDYLDSDDAPKAVKPPF